MSVWEALAQAFADTACLRPDPDPGFFTPMVALDSPSKLRMLVP